MNQVQTFELIEYSQKVTQDSAGPTSFLASLAQPKALSCHSTQPKNASYSHWEALRAWQFLATELFQYKTACGSFTRMMEQNAIRQLVSPYWLSSLSWFNVNLFLHSCNQPVQSKLAAQYSSPQWLEWGISGAGSECGALSGTVATFSRQLKDYRKLGGKSLEVRAQLIQSKCRKWRN